MRKNGNEGEGMGTYFVEYGVLKVMLPDFPFFPSWILTCHRGGSSVGVSLVQRESIHPPCLMLAQCCTDKITGFNNMSSLTGPHSITGLMTVW